jgi:hypothetical protein
VKRIAILFFVETLFGSRRRRANLPLLLACAGIAMMFWLVLAVR